MANQKSNAGNKKLSHWKRRRRRGERPPGRTGMSKMVALRNKDTDSLVSSIKAQKAIVAAALSERFAPSLQKGETMPNHELTLELAGRSVRIANDHLEALDDAYNQARIARDHHARETDRIAKKELYPEAVGVRRQIDAAFGRQRGSSLHSFTGKTPRTPDLLKFHVHRALLRLGNPDRKLPSKKKVAGEPVDRESWRRRLEAPYRKLDAAHRKLGKLRAELDLAQVLRQRAMQHFDDVYAEAFRLVEAAFLMAGLSKQMVKRLRPYYQRRRLARWARQKRETRNARQATTPASDENAKTESPPVTTARQLPAAASASVSKWLKKKSVFG